ncbi:MAG: hypothetical protein ACRD09_12475 [Vicinamibacterales bacterium]
MDLVVGPQHLRGDLRQTQARARDEIEEQRPVEPHLEDEVRERDRQRDRDARGTV